MTTANYRPSPRHNSIKMDMGQGDVHVDVAVTATEEEEEEATKKKMANSDSDNKPADEDSPTEMDNSMNRYGDAVDDATGGKAMRIESVELVLAKDESKPIWIQVAKQGKFLGHSAGPFEMTAQTFAEIIGNFHATQNKRIPIDFEHASEMSASEGGIPYMGAPAQGWITNLTVRGDGNLWGMVEWLPLAKKYIKAGQYRYLSPAIVFGAIDRVTGKPIGARLSSVALTNQPFLDGLQPVAAKDSNVSNRVDMSVALQAIRAAFSVPAWGDDRLLLFSLQFLEKTTDAEKHAATLREALRLPLTMQTSQVFKVACIACGEPPEEIKIPSPALPANPIETPASTVQEKTIMTDANKEPLETKVSQLTLQLSEAQAKVKSTEEESTAKLKLLTDENVELKKKLDAHDARELTDLVDVTIATYGEKKGLTEASRPHLLTIAKTARESFDAMYPLVPPGQRHLGNTIASGTHEVPKQSFPANEQSINLREIVSEANVPTLDVMVATNMKNARDAGISMSRDEAYTIAMKERPKLIAAATKKHMNGGA